MTLAELKAKNEAIRKQRAMLVARENKKQEPIKEEKPVESEKVEENKLEEEAEPEKKAPAKKGRKPANREYMVVEDIDGVND